MSFTRVASSLVFKISLEVENVVLGRLGSMLVEEERETEREKSFLPDLKHGLLAGNLGSL